MFQQVFLGVGEGRCAMLFVRRVTIFWRNLQPTLQNRRAVFNPDDAGRKFLRNIGTKPNYKTSHSIRILIINALIT